MLQWDSRVFGNLSNAPLYFFFLLLFFFFLSIVSSPKIELNQLEKLKLTADELATNKERHQV